MNKTWIIIKREFFARTKKKTFLLTTILLPLLLFGFYAGIIYFSVKGESEKKIAIIDQYNLLNEKLEPITGLTPVFMNNADPETLKANFEKEGFHGFLTIPADLNLDKPETISLFVKTPVGISTQERLESRINKAIERRKLELLLAADVRPERL
ncbi:MAG TPA: ABC transporter permease, partial [Parasegetibacter sp.]